MPRIRGRPVALGHREIVTQFAKTLIAQGRWKNSAESEEGIGKCLCAGELWRGTYLGASDYQWEDTILGAMGRMFISPKHI